MKKNQEWDAGAFAKEVHSKIGPDAAEDLFRSVKSIEEKFNYVGKEEGVIS